MKSDKWVTLNRAITRLNFKGISGDDAGFALETAMHNGEIANRKVQSDGSSNSYEAGDLIELRIADFDLWENSVLGVKPKNNGGRPPGCDWQAVDREIMHIIHTQKPLPRQSKVIELILDWMDKNWEERPERPTVKKHVSKIYSRLKKGS